MASSTPKSKIPCPRCPHRLSDLSTHEEAPEDTALPESPCEQEQAQQPKYEASQGDKTVEQKVEKKSTAKLPAQQTIATINKSHEANCRSPNQPSYKIAQTTALEPRDDLSVLLPTGPTSKQIADTSDFQEQHFGAESDGRNHWLTTSAGKAHREICPVCLGVVAHPPRETGFEAGGDMANGQERKTA